MGREVARLPSGPLRVLAVIASSELGGAERAFVSLLKGLDGARFEVWVACPDEGPMMGEYRQVAAGLRSFPLLNIFSPRTVLALARWMGELGCGIVHTHLWTADVIGGLAARVARVPVRVATAQGEYFRVVDEQGAGRARKALLSRIYRSVYHLFDRVIAVSRTVAEDLAHRPGLRVDPGRVVVIHNGLDLSRLQRLSGNVNRETLGLSRTAPVVITVAAFVPMKGHRWLVEAMPRVLQRFPEATFIFAGAGSELPTIRRLVAAAALDGQVRFLGPREDALELLALSNLVVMPSVAAEGSSIIALEAQALGKPVVATRVGGLPEVIEDGRTGLLVPPRQPEALAEAICALLSNPAHAQALGEKGRERVRVRFTLETMVRQTERIYLDLALAKGLLGAGGYAADGRGVRRGDGAHQ